jgi:hypothetical protein
MIHARMEGETFGLSIGEFSSLNKPVITNISEIDNAHIEILGDKGLIYKDLKSLIIIFINFETIKNSKSDWNAYNEYTPYKVMEKFYSVFKVFVPDRKEVFVPDRKEVFVPDRKEVFVPDRKEVLVPDRKEVLVPEQVETINRTSGITIVTAFYDIGRGNWDSMKRTPEYYIESFMKYLELDYSIIVFMDLRYIRNIINIPKKNVIIIPIDESFLKTNIYAWKNIENDRTIMKSEFYKKIVNNRIKNGHPENIYPEYNCINHAKIDFINFALPFIKTSFVCWSDFGYHSSILHNNSSKFPKDVLDINLFNTSKINCCLVNKIEEYDSVSILQNAPDIFTGSFYGLPLKLISEFQELYHSCLDELYSMNISDDDQHVMLKCYYKNPELFEIYLSEDGKWPEALSYFQKKNTEPIVCVNVPTGAAGLANTLKGYISWLSINENTKIESNFNWISGNYSEILHENHIYKSGNVKMYSHWRFIVLKEEEEYQQNIINDHTDSIDFSGYSSLISNKVHIDLCYSRSLICDKIFNRIIKGIDSLIWNNIVLLEVNSILKLLKGKKLGVSVRTWKSIHENNVNRKYNKEEYFKAINSFYGKIDTLFISFDNLEEEKEYSSELSKFNYIIYRKPENITFLQYSCIKMLILSNCENFICNRISTFSEMVFWLSRCKQNVIALF